MPRFVDLDLFSIKSTNLSVIFVLSEQNLLIENLAALHTPGKYFLNDRSLKNCSSINKINKESKIYCKYNFDFFRLNISDFESDFIYYHCIWSLLETNQFKTESVFYNNNFINSSSRLSKYDTNLGDQINSIMFSKTLQQLIYIFLSLLKKSEHKGLSGKDIELFVSSCTFRILSKLIYVLTQLIPHLIFNRILIGFYSSCSRQNVSNLRYRLADYYFQQFNFFLGPPCLQCPVISECSLQGNINPFDCIYVESLVDDIPSPYIE